MVLICGLATAQDRLPSPEPATAFSGSLRPLPAGLRPAAPESAEALRRWRYSVTAVVAAQGFDAASSWGGRELNPLLAARGQRFDAQAATVKFGLAAALLGLECFILRRNPRHAKFFTRLNWVAAGATTGVAVRNLAVR